MCVVHNFLIFTILMFTKCLDDRGVGDDNSPTYISIFWNVAINYLRRYILYTQKYFEHNGLSVEEAGM